MDAGAHPGRRHAGVLVRSHSRHDGDREALAAARHMSRRARVARPLAGRLGSFALDVDVRGADARRHGAVRAVGLGQDRRSCAASRGSSTGAVDLERRHRQLAGRTAENFSRRISGRSAMCSRRRACSLTSRCAAICSTAPARAHAGRRRGDPASMTWSGCSASDICSIARPARSRAASASASRSGAPCSHSPASC